MHVQDLYVNLRCISTVSEDMDLQLALKNHWLFPERHGFSSLYNILPSAVKLLVTIGA